MNGAPIVVESTQTDPTLPYLPTPYAYRRRVTREVKVGGVGIGGSNPIRVQSMTTTDTMDTEATVAQARRLVDVGCELVRITAPTPQDAENLGAIRRALLAQGIDVPIIADIHFNPSSALEAVKHCHKVRINPGNYVDQKRFAVREYSDGEYQAELERIEQRFKPLVLACRTYGAAMRIGTNHGSLSDRIMNRFGDTPLGMVESALEFVRICRAYDYHELILSMKSSNPKVMIQAYRLLAARMDALDWRYPLHLGVTEAGGGEEGRVKSALGIGSLLNDGLGDTVRVSLTEDPTAEIPVAQRLVAPYNRRLESGIGSSIADRSDRRNPYVYERRASAPLDVGPFELGAGREVRVLVREKASVMAIEPREGESGVDRVAVDLTELASTGLPADLHEGPLLVESAGGLPRAVDELLAQVVLLERQQRCDLTLSLRLDSTDETIRGYRLLANRLVERGRDYPLHLRVDAVGERLDVLVESATALGSLLCDGIGDSVEIRTNVSGLFGQRLAFHILQASGVRITKAEFIACPGCGRTLFDLESTTLRIQSRTGHLTGVRIAVMGCIVNGPGEMADADFGYVGGAPGRVNLYVGKSVVERNVPQADADERLVELIKTRGRWKEPPTAPR